MMPHNTKNQFKNLNLATPSDAVSYIENRKRNKASALIIASLPDSTVSFMDGSPYVSDSSAIGKDSLTYDLGVDGLVPLDIVTARMCGAIGYKGGADANIGDSREQILRAMTIAAKHNVPLKMEGLNYNVSEAIFTSSKLFMDGQGCTLYFTNWPAVGGFITNVWGAADIENAPIKRTQSNVHLTNIIASGEMLPPPNATQNSNLFGFARGMYDAIVENCVGRKMRVGNGGGSGGGAFGDEQGTHNVVYRNCQAEDCFRGVRIAGMSGVHNDSGAQSKVVTSQRFENFRAVRCNAAIFVHAIGAPASDYDSTNLFRFDAVFEGVTDVENCGHAAWSPYDFVKYPTIKPQKSGVITVAGGSGLYIENLRVRISSAYTSLADWLGQSSYPAAGTGFIGAGLSGNVGAVVRGWGRNIRIRNITIQGSTDALVNVDRCAALYEIASISPTNTTDVSIRIDNVDQVSGAFNYMVDGHSNLNDSKLGVNINHISLISAPKLGYVAPQLSALKNITLKILSRAGLTLFGRASDFSASNALYPADLSVMGSFAMGGGYSSVGAKYGMTYDGEVARFSANKSTQSGMIGFYNTSGLVGQIVTSGNSTVYATSSDQKLKRNFAEFDSGNILDNINVYKFNWASNGDVGYGVKAQEVVSTYPGAVVKGSEGNVIDNEYIPWSVDYSKFIPIILEEIKRLRQRLSAAEANNK